MNDAQIAAMDRILNAVAPRDVRDYGSTVMRTPVVPLPVLIAAVAAMQAIKEADAANAFTLSTPLYMQLIRATSGLAYYTDRLAEVQT